MWLWFPPTNAWTFKPYLSRIPSVANVILRLAIGTTAAGCSGGSRVDRLVLSRVESLDLGNLPVAGGWIGSDGRVLVWSNDTLVIVLGTARERRIVRLDQRVSGAALVDGKTLEVVHQDTLARVNLNGKVLSTRRLSFPYPIRQAVRNREQWFYALGPPSGFFELRVGEAGSGSKLLARLRPRPQEVGVHNWAQVSPTLHGAAVTRRLWPFETELFGNDGKKLMSIAPDTTLLARVLRRRTNDSGAWVSLPTIEFDEGFIQTVADLSSDARVVLWYNSIGELLQATRLLIPIGFVGTISTDSTLVAIRHTQRVEAVRYRWSIQKAVR